MNHMEEVAKMFGVKLGEVFKVTDDDSGKYHNYYRFTEKKGIEVSDDNIKWEANTTEVLVLKWLLIGVARIVKLPWKPRKGEKYYIPYISTQQKGMHVTYYWNNDHIDIEHYRMGLVCKTPEEAVAITMRMLDTVKELREQ